MQVHFEDDAMASLTSGPELTELQSLQSRHKSLILITTLWLVPSCQAAQDTSSKQHSSMIWLVVHGASHVEEDKREDADSSVLKQLGSGQRTWTNWAGHQEETFFYPPNSLQINLERCTHGQCNGDKQKVRNTGWWWWWWRWRWRLWWWWWLWKLMLFSRSFLTPARCFLAWAFQLRSSAARDTFHSFSHLTPLQPPTLEFLLPTPPLALLLSRLLHIEREIFLFWNKE